MKFHRYNSDFNFVKTPIEFNKYTDRDTLQYCLGSTLYMPGTKDIRDKVLNKQLDVTSFVMCCEDAIKEEDLPAAEPETKQEQVAAPVIVHEAVQASNQKTAVLDAMTAKQAWRTDMPGAPVRDIRSAISLNDRVLFINRLFGEDPVNFQETLNILNQMGSLDEAVAYLVETHPSWNLESELVYRFMMALRRRLN